MNSVKPRRHLVTRGQNKSKTRVHGGTGETSIGSRPKPADGHRRPFQIRGRRDQPGDHGKKRTIRFFKEDRRPQRHAHAAGSAIKAAIEQKSESTSKPRIKAPNQSKQNSSWPVPKQCQTQRKSRVIVPGLEAYAKGDKELSKERRRSVVLLEEGELEKAKKFGGLRKSSSLTLVAVPISLY